MRLKKIRLAGFKSFVDPTNIPFPDDMTAIVGPNGCGKSNVIDAVRWVLGESSAKNLRGDAMTDVIFNGSSVRKPVSQCSVELVFDNSSGRIQGEFAGYTELSVKRLVTREAQSFYFLNNTKCRRRDVTDLFLGTGLGPRSYAIIEQGMISRLIESKPQELRVFIEEAAGISKYKERRRETENRIKHTRENLERLEDVRLELGQQLEKLQRQAAAARRYTSLKADERRFKGELAAIRWLTFSASIESLESSIAVQETDIQAMISEQRGDETNATHLLETRADAKQQLADIQNRNFQLATEITRLEQNQIHAKQREQQVARDLAQVRESLAQCEIQQEDLSVEQEELAALVEELEPQLVEIKDREIEAAQLLLNKERELQDKQAQWRQQESVFLQLKQKIQTSHSQIQSGLQMQLRTEQRIGELTDELAMLDQDSIAEDLLLLQESLAELTAKQTDVQALIVTEEAAVKSTRESLNSAKQALEQLQKQQHSLTVKLDSLQQLHTQESQQDDSITQWLNEQAKMAVSIWQYLQVDEEWQTAFETVLQQWHNGMVCDNYTATQHINGMRLFFTEDFTKEKKPGTLASYCQAAQVPHWLNNIHVGEVANLAAIRANLDSEQSVISQSGIWLGVDWLINGADAERSGTLARLAAIAELEEQLNVIAAQEELLIEQELSAQTAFDNANEQYTASKDNQRSLQLDIGQCERQIEFTEQQATKVTHKRQRLTQDIQLQTEQLEEEKAQLEELTEQVALFEEELIELEGEHSGSDSLHFGALRQDLQAQIDGLRATQTQLQAQAHQLALSLQSEQNNLKNCRDSYARVSTFVSEQQEKSTMLQTEQASLALPLEEQAEHLAELLDERSAVEIAQRKVSNELADIEAELSDLEKGRQGVQSRIDKAKEAQQAARVECEGYKARANAVLEQLQDMQQGLKTLLTNLPEEADEKVWQAQLDKTSGALSRLGAVNLAAVEEFEVQSERKQHLDTQNDDLVAALETLEGAIRKIDRETRARFKTTYDQVNGDLQQLFPKVFGGGAAYLDLTDDDLLETGVTIMARPPGKKNSTIHLLSGGEKALTALSLVFAIFRLNPAPFCLLDEVDAPLDDANVGRFCKLVSEMSKSVQFIYITHNKIAMEMAKHLTGVTMAEPGVSRIVAVDVEEAVAIVNA